MRGKTINAVDLDLRGFCLCVFYKLHIFIRKKVCKKVIVMQRINGGFWHLGHTILRWKHLALPSSQCSNSTAFPAKVNLEGLGMAGSSPPWLGGLLPPWSDAGGRFVGLAGLSTCPTGTDTHKFLQTPTKESRLMQKTVSRALGEGRVSSGENMLCSARQRHSLHSTGFFCSLSPLFFHAHSFPVLFDLPLSPPEEQPTPTSFFPLAPVLIHPCPCLVCLVPLFRSSKALRKVTQGLWVLRDFSPPVLHSSSLRSPLSLIELPVNHLQNPAKLTALSVPKTGISVPVTEVISVLRGFTDMATKVLLALQDSLSQQVPPAIINEVGMFLV